MITIINVAHPRTVFLFIPIFIVVFNFWIAKLGKNVDKYSVLVMSFYF